MSFLEKTKFVFGLITSVFRKDEIDDIESIKDEDTLSEVMEYFKKMSPQAYNVLVTERDAYMAQSILDLNEDNIVVVVGAGHKTGITDYIQHPEKIPPMHDLYGI